MLTLSLSFPRPLSWLTFLPGTGIGGLDVGKPRKWLHMMIKEKRERLAGQEVQKIEEQRAKGEASRHPWHHFLKTHKKPANAIWLLSVWRQTSEREWKEVLPHCWDSHSQASLSWCCGCPAWRSLAKVNGEFLDAVGILSKIDPSWLSFHHLSSQWLY